MYIILIVFSINIILLKYLDKFYLFSSFNWPCAKIIVNYKFLNVGTLSSVHVINFKNRKLK